jgi:diacylglycerol kinase/membrane-associated PAP2 superfamily phosphatase
VCIAVVAMLARSFGVDEHLETLFFDARLAGFPARQWPWLEAIGHRVAKSAVLGVWLLLVAAALAAMTVPRWRAYSGLLWTTVAAMGLGPLVVVVLKELNAYRCPWDLAQFGGVAQATSGWFVSRVNAGRCFPSGHAAGGFSLVALGFAGIALGHRGLRRAGLGAAVAVGVAFSLVRMAQGAHFLSHNLWSAAIDWCAAALVFAPAIMLGRYAGTTAAEAARDQDADRSKPGAATGVVRIVRAASYSMSGLRAVWRREAAFRQEACAAGVLIPLALIVPATAFQRGMLVVSLLLVLAVELLNSAIETVVDLLSPQHHPLAGIAKDAGSAAVLISLLIAAVVWIVVLAEVL